MATPTQTLGDGAPRVGVFICDCGGEITDRLDADAVQRAAGALPSVTHSERLSAGCDPDGLAVIRARVASMGLDRVVIAGCSPRIVGRRFETAGAALGVDPQLIEVANVRDHVARVHATGGEPATDKAVDLVRMATAHVAARHPVPPRRIAPHQGAAVLGGGAAGLSAALALAERGIPVLLLERERALGGRAPAALARTLVERVQASPSIEVRTGATLHGVTGTYGRYEVRFAVGHDGPVERRPAGALILATGLQPVTPTGHYGYGNGAPRPVCTQAELSRRLEGDSVVAGAEQIVMIQCVGAFEASHPGCGRTCCVSAVDNALRLLAARPGRSCTIVHRGMPTEPGLGARALAEAAAAGITFLQFAPDTPPVADAAGIRVHPVGADGLPGEPVTLPCDLLVLSTPWVPDPRTAAAAAAFRLPVDRSGFVPDTRPDLQPHQYAPPASVVAGNAHGPCTPDEAMAQGYAAAARVAHLLGRGTVTATPFAATVEAERCRGCATCRAWCPYDVPEMQPRDSGVPLSAIDPFRCTGCGACLVHCPTGAIDIPNRGDDAYQRQFDALIQEPTRPGVRAVAFACNWSGYAVADLAGAHRTELPPEVTPVRIPCAARLSPGLVLRAFEAGADGVLAATCGTGDCHYRAGQHNWEQIIATTRALLRLAGIDGTRFQTVSVSAVDVPAYSERLRTFVADLQRLGRRAAPRLPAASGVS